MTTFPGVISLRVYMHMDRSKHPPELEVWYPIAYPGEFDPALAALNDWSEV